MMPSKLILLLFMFGLNWNCCLCANLPAIGSCPVKETVGNFDMNRFIGLWYINARYPFLEETLPICITQEYKKDKKGFSVKETATLLPPTKDTVKQKVIIDVPLKNITKDGHFVMYTKEVNLLARVAVLDTDYKNYAILHTCIDFGSVFHYESGIIASRFAKPSKDILQLANDTLLMNGIGLKKLKQVSHEGC